MMENKKHTLKRLLACVMVVVMAVTAVPMSGFVGLELPKWSQGLATQASAATSGYYTYTVSNGKATISRTDSSLSGNVTIPSKLGGYPVTAIGSSAFKNLTGIKSVIIPDSVTSIGIYAFKDCTGLTSITIPDSVTSIGHWAFAYTAWSKAQPFGDVYAGKVYYTYKGTMPENTSIVIKDGTKGIADDAFSDCDGLTSVTIPDSVTSIGSSAFSGCTGLTSITIPNSVTSIGESAFKGCTGLTSVTIPNSVKSIGESAFIGCTALTNVTIQDSITTIGSDAFADTAWYQAQPFGDVYAGKVYYKYKGTTPKNTSVVIKNGTKGIAGSAFYDCDGLTSITIPDSVTSIGDFAFFDCDGLTSITIPDSVTSIGDSVFYSCYGLKNITRPDSVTSIGNFAFRY